MTKPYKYQHIFFLFWVREKYKYDALGNMLKMKSVGNWTREYFYDNLTNQLLKHDEQSANEYTYYEHGNMLTMPHLSSMVWNEKDELIGASNGTFTSYYNYDSQGNRTRKVVVKNNVREERYYINGYEVFRKYVCDSLDFERVSTSVYSIKVSQEELPKENENDKPQVITKYEIDTYNRILLLETKTIENGQAIANTTTNVRYQYSNHLGSACLELNEIGEIISYEEFHPFGTTAYKSKSSEVEVSKKRYRYCGKERDEESGLYYYGARYYASWLCRFVSCDPHWFKYPHATPYNYCNNSPINIIDPDGKDGWTRFWGGLRAIGGGLQIAAGAILFAVPEPTMLTKVGGTVAVTHGADDVQTGLRQLWTGEEKKSLTEKGVTATAKFAGADENTAELIGSFTDVGLSFVGGGAGSLKTASVMLKTSSKFAVASEFGFKSAKLLRAEVLAKFGTGSGYQVHHLIEKRFAHLFGQKIDDMISMVLTAEEHQKFTNAWNSLIGRDGTFKTLKTTSTALKEDVIKAAKEVYKNYPEILKALDFK